MRVLLAIGAFILALPFLGYGGFLLFVLIQFFLGEDIDADTGFVVAIAGVALLIGLAFLAAGVAVLASKSRSNQQAPPCEPGTRTVARSGIRSTARSS